MRSFTAIKNGFTPVEQQYAEGNQGPWTDEYAMAATIYYSITGIIPPESVKRAIRKNNDPLQKPSSLIKGLPKYVEDALLKGLSVQKEDRFPDMAAFEKALYNERSAAGGIKAGALIIGGGKKYRIPIIAAIASLAVIVAVLFALNQRNLFEDGGEQTVTDTPTSKPTKTDTPSPNPAATKTPSPKPTATNTPTPKPTATNTPTPKPTATNTPTPKPTATNTPTPKPTATNTPTPVPTATNTPTPEPTATNVPAPEPTAENTPTPNLTPLPALNWENHFELSDADVGAVVYFGKYFIRPDVLEPIEWYVIGRDGDKVLLLSKYILDVVGGHDSNHWVNSKIRIWLNYSFINKAFTESEKGRICMSTVKNDEDIGDGRQGVKDAETEDRIFLLSYEEINSGEYPYASVPTEYAISKGAFLAENGTGAIHTRSFYTGSQGEGGIYMYWDDVDPGESGVAVQPAMWVYTGPSY